MASATVSAFLLGIAVAVAYLVNASVMQRMNFFVEVGSKHGSK
jgi:hypothetical protein